MLKYAIVKRSVFKFKATFVQNQNNGKIITIFTLILLLACNPASNTKDYTEENEQEILKYLEDNNLTAEKSSSGLYYIIDNAGTGTKPNASSNVTVAYKGYFTDGSVFDESDAQGISFSLQNVIEGWTEGISYFKEGGNGVLLVPSRLGYGNNGRTGIPGGAVLVFDVALISVN